jgi:hypothetical protein
MVSCTRRINNDEEQDCFPKGKESAAMSIGAIVFVLIAIIIVFGAFKGIRGQRKWQKEFRASLRREGFIESPDSKAYGECPGPC